MNGSSRMTRFSFLVILFLRAGKKAGWKSTGYSKSGLTRKFPVPLGRGCKIFHIPKAKRKRKMIKYGHGSKAKLALCVQFALSFRVSVEVSGSVVE